MHPRNLLRFLSVLILNTVSIVGEASVERLTRLKRYLVFPEGSSISVAVCLSVQTGIIPGEIYSISVNWGISYELPKDTKHFKEFFDKPKAAMQRRHRRELYKKLETIVNLTALIRYV